MRTGALPSCCKNLNGRIYGISRIMYDNLRTMSMVAKGYYFSNPLKLVPKMWPFIKRWGKFPSIVSPPAYTTAVNLPPAHVARTNIPPSYPTATAINTPPLYDARNNAPPLHTANVNTPSSYSVPENRLQVTSVYDPSQNAPGNGPNSIRYNTLPAYTEPAKPHTAYTQVPRWPVSSDLVTAPHSSTMPHRAPNY